MAVRTRREPPPFRRVTVRSSEWLSPRLVRVTFSGDDSAGLTVEQPAASVRLLLPSPGADELVMPAWNGNEFLLPDGRRPVIRTFTPRRADPETHELDLDVVVHGSGVASQWAAHAEPGAAAAVSGPGRGYTIAADADTFLLAGDETAIAAISQLLEYLPAKASVRVLIEIAAPEAQVELPAHPGATVEWCESLVDAVQGVDVGPTTRIWVAGEAESVQAIRRYLFQERGIPRAQASVRGYWKRGRTGDDSADA